MSKVHPINLDPGARFLIRGRMLDVGPIAQQTGPIPLVIDGVALGTATVVASVQGRRPSELVVEVEIAEWTALVDRGEAVRDAIAEAVHAMGDVEVEPLPVVPDLEQPFAMVLADSEAAASLVASGWELHSSVVDAQGRAVSFYTPGAQPVTERYVATRRELTEAEAAELARTEFNATEVAFDDSKLLG